MKIHALIGLFLFALVSLSFTGADKKLPSVNLLTKDGSSVNIQEYTSNGKIQLVSLWATWCGPCRQELNGLKAYHQKWADKYGVEIIAVSVDSKKMIQRAYAMAESKGWDYTILYDSKKELQAALGVRGIPFSVLIDGEGNIISESQGYYRGYEADIEKKIQKLQNKS
jgi:thiol-disulfide isomerase/thioredoxin